MSFPATFGGAKSIGGGQLLRNGRAFSLVRGREQRSRRSSSLATRSALASPELTHVLKEYGVPAVLTHACGWFVCMVALFSAANSGLNTDVLISYLPATFQEHFDGGSATSLFRFQLSLAVTEAIGPFRVAVTLAATPKVAEFLRGNDAGRNVEAFGIRLSRKSARGVIQLRDRFSDAVARYSFSNFTL
eukprot:CAMPEP_0172179874 /NCGR_PEP_ID=MMETSP1050-20130122/16877_1 /TAXON_ID=233186 /ORGANISM="Cryptomonas curvata, Strain CCAP979/52" /LENGTH=188 /DNA_ID=CAMNT_0012852839 /DNA_START=127 /DNA_END=693 /DNA_ORIENTATION=+